MKGLTISTLAGLTAILFACNNENNAGDSETPLRREDFTIEGKSECSLRELYTSDRTRLLVVNRNNKTVSLYRIDNESIYRLSEVKDFHGNNVDYGLSQEMLSQLIYSSDEACVRARIVSLGNNR